MFGKMTGHFLSFQNQICTNQIRRMDEENKNQKVQLEAAAQKESELHKEVKALLRKIDDLESKVGLHYPLSGCTRIRTIYWGKYPY